MVTLAVILLIIGISVKRSPKEQVALGPMPAEDYLPDPLARSTAGDLRKWVQDFKSPDAKKLNDTGKITFSWAELTAAYPKTAKLLDDYIEQRRIGMKTVDGSRVERRFHPGWPSITRRTRRSSRE